MSMRAGACELAAALTPAAMLSTLDANENGIGAEGATALAAALQAGSPLRVLRLRGNAIGDAGAAALGSALVREPPLEELDVGHNQVRAFLPCATLHAGHLHVVTLYGLQGRGHANRTASSEQE